MPENKSQYVQKVVLRKSRTCEHFLKKNFIASLKHITETVSILQINN